MFEKISFAIPYFYIPQDSKTKDACYLAMVTDYNMGAAANLPLPLFLPLHLSLFRYSQCIIDFNSEIAHGAFQLCMTKQQLNGAKILGAPVD